MVFGGLVFCACLESVFFFLCWFWNYVVGYGHWVAFVIAVNRQAPTEVVGWMGGNYAHKVKEYEFQRVPDKYTHHAKEDDCEVLVTAVFLVFYGFLYKKLGFFVNPIICFALIFGQCCVFFIKFFEGYVRHCAFVHRQDFFNVS
ncbi:putative m140 protein [Bufonid herpesvirus 1]|uniref:putative m140 protein n=1 Tax=Bufonid herpesvirus 1 TaxID=2282206 RepID=UPI000EB6D5E4|nr:putative m140 protein [Bufonid herpesvirus 1]AXF48505.1 putative m140 protein [Bufonid herpesvirus 1]